MGQHISTKRAKAEALKDITKSLQEDQINYTWREKEVFNMLEFTKQQNVELSALEHVNKFVLPYTNH